MSAYSGEAKKLLRTEKFSWESESAPFLVSNGSQLEGMTSSEASEGQDLVTSAADHFSLRDNLVEHISYLKRFEDKFISATYSLLRKLQLSGLAATIMVAPYVLPFFLTAKN